MVGRDAGAHQNAHQKGHREHSGFQSRTATDEAGELNRRSSQSVSPTQDQRSRPSVSREPSNPYGPATNDSPPSPREHSLTKRRLRTDSHDGNDKSSDMRKMSASGRRRTLTMGEGSLTIQAHNEAESKKANASPSTPKPGLGPRPIGGDEKLGMFSGVYVPTCLNVLSILMFLRFGFILGLFCHIWIGLGYSLTNVQAREECLVSWAC